MPREHATRRPGEVLLLINFAHQPANTPYRAFHAIYVRKVASAAFEAVDVEPDVLASRLLSIRAFDTEHKMIAADVCQGDQAAMIFERILANPQTAYLQVHNALRGCYAARVERAKAVVGNGRKPSALQLAWLRLVEGSMLGS